LETPHSSLPISDTSRFVASRDQVSCNLADEAAIVNLRNGVYYGLDPVGTRIWSVLREPVTFAEIRDALLSDFEVEPQALESDVRDFLRQLAEQGLIEITS
jgi:hypothetical protein